MDVRRLNDTLKIVGGVIAGMTALGPLCATHYDSWQQFLGALIPSLITLVSAYVAGFGTRAKGTEYQDVADAKAIAKVSMMPPPISVKQ